MAADAGGGRRCEPLRLIQVGAGAMGRAWLAGRCAESADVELVGLVDLDADDRAAGGRRARASPTCRVAGSLAELLDRVDADAVINVTVPARPPRRQHRGAAAGLPVLCEKPLAESVAEGLSMIAAAELSGQLLMVSQSRRYWRAADGVPAARSPQLGPIGIGRLQLLQGAALRRLPRGDGRTRCWSTWPSTSSTWPAT